jgi:hypothetical protein
MTEPTEPHVNVFQFGDCIACGASDSWSVITIPQLATGLQFPQHGICDACGHKVDLSDLPPFTFSIAPPDDV